MGLYRKINGPWMVDKPLAGPGQSRIYGLNILLKKDGKGLPDGVL